MANTYTSRFNLTKPEVGADTNAWGGHLNADLDTIDSNMVSLLLTSAQTMAGALNLPSNGLNVGSGQLQVTGGNVSLSGNFSAVNGSFTGTMSVGGAATFAGASFSGAVTMATTLTVTGLVTASTAPTAGGHLTNKTFTDATYVAKSGSIMTGDLDTSGNMIAEKFMFTRDIGKDTGFRWWQDGQFIGVVNGADKYFFDGYGNFTASGNVTAYSDARLKSNVQTIKKALSLVNQMRGVFFDRIDTGEHGVGVIAQEMQEVLPQVVVPNDGTLSVAYGNLVGVLIEAVKELSAKVEALETR